MRGGRKEKGKNKTVLFLLLFPKHHNIPLFLLFSQEGR